jgi:hypothetical protein
MKSLDGERGESERRFYEDILRDVPLTALNAEDLPEESLSAVSEENFFELRKALLTVVADVVLETNISIEVSQASRKIVFFGMERACTWAETFRHAINASILAVLSVHGVCPYAAI